eukprot:3099256-Alexandrium_andersonii.AAC.1
MEVREPDSEVPQSWSSGGPRPHTGALKARLGSSELRAPEPGRCAGAWLHRCDRLARVALDE